MKRLVAKFRDSYKVTRTTAFATRAFWSALAPVRRWCLPLMLRRRREVHVHFGCGDVADPRFINVDARALPHVHLVTRSPLLHALGTSSADSFYACHVFEHLSFRHQHATLTRWREILKPGGRLLLSVPDFDKLVALYLRSGSDARAVQETLMGGQDYPGNFHYAILTDTHLRNLLGRAGFVDVQPWHPRHETAWPHDWSWADDVSLNLSARKPAATVPTD